MPAQNTMLNNLKTFRFLLAIALLTLLMACKKDAATAADPRDPYVGTWIEQSTNGAPIQAGAARDTMVITKSGDARLQIARLIYAGAFTASPVSSGSGYQADNLPIRTGTTFVFQSGARTEVMLDKMSMVLSGEQIILTTSYSAKAGTQTASQDYVSTMKKQ